MIYANQDVYDAEWVDDRKHGNGKMIFFSGTLYEG